MARRKPSFLSSRSSPEYRRSALIALADTYATKPLGPDRAKGTPVYWPGLAALEIDEVLSGNGEPAGTPAGSGTRDAIDRDKLRAIAKRLEKVAAVSPCWIPDPAFATRGKAK